MRHHDAGLRHEFMEPGAHPLHGFHAIVDKVGLPAAAELAKNGLSNGFLAEAENLRADGQAARRGRIDDRKVAHTRHGHL